MTARNKCEERTTVAAAAKAVAKAWRIVKAAKALQHLLLLLLLRWRAENLGIEARRKNNRGINQRNGVIGISGGVAKRINGIFVSVSAIWRIISTW